ncbi:DNA cytosine methyltransferase [Microbacterium sp. 22242]|uniref:DNA cytosine methyltransferase n=1 Tax=Microbacterium sp. 22242 TaxID=3453896 RepID=UPI003F8259BD
MLATRKSLDIPFLDFFAGFGGSSTGLYEAGFVPHTAFNHWNKAIAVHSANHRQTDHVQGDLSGYDMRRLPKGVPVLWASPECTWHSPAGGRKRPRELDLFDEYVPNDAGERSRSTMWDPIRAAEARPFDVILIENVSEVVDWRTAAGAHVFPSWMRTWEDLGYEWQIVNASAAHVYSATNDPAGQWRDRIYIVLYRKGIRMPRIEPRPPAWCDQCQGVVEAVQSWKKDPHFRVGKYGRQYVYVCGANQHARQVVEPYVLPAASVIDWSDLGGRIGDRKKPLAAATMRRVEMGIRMFARPAVVQHAGQTWDAANPQHRGFGDPNAYYRVTDPSVTPLMTRQAGGTGDALSVPPFYTAINHDADDRARLLESGPLPTRSTKIGDGLVFATVLSHQYGEQTGSDRRNSDPWVVPLGAVTAGGAHHNLIVPPYMVEMYGTSTARDTENPLSTVTAEGNHHWLTTAPDAFLSRQYTQRGSDANINTSPSGPLHAITGSGGNHALVVPSRQRPSSMYEGDLPFDLDDVRFRMLGPNEHLRAQRFPNDYDTSAANKSETTKGAGNAVPVNVAHWIGDNVAEALGSAA